MVGLMPEKVIGAAVMIATVAAPAREESTFETATSVTVQGVEVVDVVQVVGIVAGAVYFPVESMLPQPGSQCAAVVEIGVACVRNQVTSLGVVSTPVPAVNWKVSLVPTVAVNGVTVTRMPESSIIVDVAVFFVSAFAVAVMITLTLGNFV